MGCSSSKVSPPSPEATEDAKPTLDHPPLPGSPGGQTLTPSIANDSPLEELVEEDMDVNVDEGPQSPEFGVIEFAAFTAPLPLYDDGLITHGDVLSAILPTVMKPKMPPKEEGEDEGEGEEGDGGEVTALEEEKVGGEEGEGAATHGPRVYTTPFLPTALLTSVPYGQCLALNSAPEGEDPPGGEGATINGYEPATVYVGKLRLGTALARRVPYLTPMVSQVTRVHPIDQHFGASSLSLSLSPSASTAAMASALAAMEPQGLQHHHVLHHEAHVPLSLLEMQALRSVAPPPTLALLLASHPGSVVLSSHPLGHPQWVMIRADRGPMEQAQQAQAAVAAASSSLLPSLLEAGRKELSSTVRRYCTMGLPPPLMNVGYYEVDVFVATPVSAEVDMDGGGGPYVEIPRVPLALVKLPYVPPGGRGEGGVSVTSYGGLKMGLDLIHSLRVAPTAIKNRGLDLYEGLSQFAGQDYR